MFEQVTVNREVFGNGENLLICGSVMKLPEEIRALAGKAQCVYVDPPFMTGEKFMRRRPYGEKGWRTGTPAPRYPAYEDRYTSEKQYLRLLRRIASVGKELLSETGVFYLHLDWRMAAPARVMCDKVFGKTRFLNEIIWSYESGGRAKRYFSRKHDVILLYAKSNKYFFDLTRVPLPRGRVRRNHMARGRDEQGRMFSRITSNGKEYRYYDDEPVYPGDVWTDISHLQQRDPERTGYATQKPLKLLERLLLPVTNPGDLVADLCCGSGTALEAARQLDCRFAGLDLNPEAIAVCQNRLPPKDLTVACPCGGEAALLAENDTENGRFTIGGLEVSHPDFPAKTTPLDSLESWETGVIRDGVFYADQSFRRSFRYPELQQSLKTEQAVEAVMTTDAAGIRRAYSTK
ncbi:MAG: site-specific DNA-methyltransferase [Clostridia bacterium]|nr:site-specific DNA-methyltransferase [Clostridia bacterium]